MRSIFKLVLATATLVGLLCVSAVALAASAGGTVARPASPQVQQLTGPKKPARNPLKNLDYAPGRLVLKMKSSVDACIDCRLNAGKKLAPALGSRRLDRLNRFYGLRGASPLIDANRKIKSLSQRRKRERSLLRRAVRKANRGRAAGVADLRRAPNLASTYVLKVSPWLDMEKVAKQYARDPKVAYAQPDRKVEASMGVNDPYFSTSGSWNQSFDDLWGIKKINAPAAWDTTRGEGTVVAVVDTGADLHHKDMVDGLAPFDFNNYWKNPGEVYNNQDDDNNGYIDDINGWDFVFNDQSPDDFNGHGTHVAGTVAAVGNNNFGVVGVAWDSRIMVVRGLNSNGSGYSSDLAAGIIYAGNNGADVINASWGGYGDDPVVSDAIAQANAQGAVFVAAAGNDDLDVRESFGGHHPASNPLAIAVAATDHNDEKAFFSNHGNGIDVAAPGGGDEGAGVDTPEYSILSLASQQASWPTNLKVGGIYVRIAGTSMAAPHVSGVAALIRSVHPDYTPAQVRQALRVGADDIGDPGRDDVYGYGRINAASSVGLEVPNVELTAPVEGYGTTGDQIVVSGTASGSGSSFQSYTLEYGDGDEPSSWTTIAGPIGTQVTNDQLGVWDITNLDDGDYTVRVRVTNTAGANFEQRATITIDRTQITSPASSSIQRLDGPIEVKGTARGPGFEHYAIEWRQTTPDYSTGPWQTTGVTLAANGDAPVEDGTLATIAPETFPQSSELDLRLVVTRSGSDAVQERRHVIVDPSLRAGFPQQVPGLPAPLFSDPLNSSFTIKHHSTVADVDDNGTKEIIVAYGDMVFVFRSDGSLLPGWPQIMQSQNASPSFARQSPAAADLDNDGDLEIVASDAAKPGYWTAPGAVFVWHHDGTAMSGWPKEVNSNYEQVGDGGPRGDFALSDVDNDGYRDIIFVAGPSLMVMDRNGDMLPGWPKTGPCILADYCIGDVVSVGDIVGDAKKEIAVVTSARKEKLLVFDAEGNNVSGFPKSLGGKAYGLPGARYTGYNNSPLMADFNGDGKLDIAVMGDRLRMSFFTGAGGKLKLKPSKAKGTLNKACGSAIPPILDPATAGDINDDGKAELIVSSHVGLWKVGSWYGGPILTKTCNENTKGPDYINVMGASVSPGWPAAIDYPSGDNTYGPGSIAVGDIDGDQSHDLVSASGICGKWEKEFGAAGHRCFTVNAFDKQGQLLPGFPKATPAAGPSAGTTPAIADFDGDGYKEITTIDADGNLLAWDVPGTPGPEKNQWPMFRHDPAHTGALVANP